MSIIHHAVKTVCINENVLKAFTATGVISCNPNKIDFKSFPFQSSRN